MSSNMVSHCGSTSLHQSCVAFTKPKTFSQSNNFKYVQQTLEIMKNRPADSEEDPSILGI